MSDSEDHTASSADELAPSVKKAKVLSNKTIDPKQIPKKPSEVSMKAPSEPFEFRLTITNSQLLNKFLEPVAHSVKRMKFMLVKSTSFTGFRMEAHDQFLTIANKSRFECDVEGTETNFCVSAKSFMQALSASSLKDTTLCITKYHKNPDTLTFEAENNENDVRTVYTCALVENNTVQSLDNISLNLGFHVSIYMTLFRELSLNARKCTADVLAFDLWQATDKTDPTITHSRMTIGFTGMETSGSHEFFMSAKQSTKVVDEKSINVWEPLSTTNLDIRSLQMELKCHNEYDNNKLRLFLNHMEGTWVLVHLCNDNTAQPLVLEFILGSKNTKHCVIIAPKIDE